MPRSNTKKMTADLWELIANEINWDPEVTSGDIIVRAHDGFVTLTGSVPAYCEKVAAEVAAKRVYGTRAVANEIVVLPRSPRSDPEILNSAIQALRNNQRVPDANIRIQVKAGWVTLSGEVEWQFQRRLAESAISELPGVCGLTDQVMVKPKVVPLGLRIRIEGALRRSAEVDVRRIKVEAAKGDVRLSGSVGSWSEREAAEQAAWAAPGVCSVDNQISVVPEEVQLDEWFPPAFDTKVQSPRRASAGLPRGVV